MLEIAQSATIALRFDFELILYNDENVRVKQTSQSIAGVCL